MKHTLLSHARALRSAEGGVAAVEMALIAPVALALLSLVVGSGQSLSYWRRTVLVAHTVTDLVARTPNQPDASVADAGDIAQSDLVNDLALSQLVMYPAPTNALKIVLTQIKIDGAANKGAVVWSQGYNGATPTPCGTVFPLNSDLTAAGAKYMVVGAASYSFKPLGVFFDLSPISLSANDMLTIRYSQQLIVTDVADTSSFNVCS